jgi:uncharacterized membrane protein
MFTLPPVPSWSGLHPLVIHFPIVLLLIAPLFVVIGAALSPRKAKAYLLSALLLMVLGTVSTYFAVETGEEAGKLADRTPQINQVLQHHEELAERTRLSFTILSVVFAAIVALPMVLKRDSRTFTTALPIVFLFLYSGAAVFLVNTAHNGGRLVHEFGVQALVASPDEASSQQGQ